MAGQEDVATLVAVWIGLVLSCGMFFAHFPALRVAMQKGQLGAINPDPFPTILANCIGWCFLGVIRQDWYLFAGNAPGILSGVAGSAVCYHLTDSDAVRRKITALLAVTALWYMAMGILNSFRSAEAFVGVAANVICFAMFASPLSQIRTIVKTKDSSSIDRRFMIMQIINCSMWVIYALGVRNWYQLPPVTAGTLLGCLQLLAVLKYPRNATPADEAFTKASKESPETSPSKEAITV